MCHSPALAALILLVMLALFAGCGGRTTTPTPGVVAPTTPTRAAELAAQATPPTPAPSPTRIGSSTRSATPRSGPVPPPTPDPAAAAAGAPLRATLLAQLDEYERDWCATSPKSATRECRVDRGRSGFAERFPALARYTEWVQWTRCHYSDRGYLHPADFYYPPLSQMREPWRLDVYVSGAEWCGRRGPAAPGTPTR